MPAQVRVIFAQLEAPLRIAAALFGYVNVTAFRAAHFDDDALSLLRHVFPHPGPYPQDEGGEKGLSSFLFRFPCKSLR